MTSPFRPGAFSLLLLACLFSSVLASISCQKEKARERTIRPSSARDYSCRLEAPVKEIQAEEGEVISLNLTLFNIGRRSLSSRSAESPCFLSYHLLDSRRQVIRYDNPRYPLPHDVRPKEKSEVKVRLLAPLEPGRYWLEFDLVLEGRAWFHDYGSKTLFIPLEVKSVRFPEDRQSLTLEEAPFTAFQTDIEEFNRLQRLIRLTLYHGEIRFRGKSGDVAGFMAGTGYPQVWVRDSTTIIPASRFYYEENFLSTWLEEILSFQDQDGSLPDWVDASGRVDKNTTETDQEASAVQAAASIARVLGEKKGRLWLRKKVAGERIIDRLERALNYVLNHRYEPSSGLILGAHTADWGDVETGEADQKAIYAGSNTLWTVDIYDQSMFYQAAMDLCFLWGVVGDRGRSSFWQEQAAGIKERTNLLLWQEERGFYRIHRHIQAPAHAFDEDEMFPMGGNAQAILSGLASAEQARRIIAEALRRQQAFGISTISGSLLPPYPQGFFSHPLMDDPYEYQNGGQWDWFGGRLVAAMYEYGFSREATRCLLEIARKNLGRGGFFEWDTPEGDGRGSENYAGSAGALGLALFEGFLGLKVDREIPVLSPRIGKGRARVHVYFPAKGLFYAYEYSCDELDRRLEFSFNSNDRRQGEVNLLFPWGRANQFRVELDGQPVAFSSKQVGDDFYVVVPADFARHRLMITAR